MDVGVFAPETPEEAQEFLCFLRELVSIPGLSSDSPGEAFLAVKAAKKATAEAEKAAASAAEEARMVAAEAAAEATFLRKVFGYRT